MTTFYETFKNNILTTPQDKQVIIYRGEDEDFIDGVNINDSLYGEDNKDAIYGYNSDNFLDSEGSNDLNISIVDDISRPCLSDRTHQYLAEDPDDLFKNICLHNDVRVNFKTIALAKLSGKSLTEIAAELNVDIENLSSFFQDCCCYYADWFESKL